MCTAAITEPGPTPTPHAPTARGFVLLRQQESANPPTLHEWNSITRLQGYEGNPEVHGWRLFSGVRNGSESSAPH